MSSTRRHEAETEKGGAILAHSRTWAEVIEDQRTDLENGLTQAESETRLAAVGKNELDDFEQTSAAEVLLRQTVNAMNMVFIDEPLRLDVQLISAIDSDHGNGRQLWH